MPEPTSKALPDQAGRRLVSMSVGELIGEVKRLRAENEALKTERDRYKGALEDIDRLEGKVCPEYETCEHVGCQSSYGAWSIANGALHCTDPLGAEFGPASDEQFVAIEKAYRQLSNTNPKNREKWVNQALTTLAGVLSPTSDEPGATT